MSIGQAASIACVLASLGSYSFHGEEKLTQDDVQEISRVLKKKGIAIKPSRIRLKYKLIERRRYPRS